MVDVYFDLSGGTPPISVSLAASGDAGATYAVPVGSVTGNVGGDVTAGTNRKITWNAGTDWDGQFSAAVKLRITASGTPPVPAGFALIPAGSFDMGNALSASGDGYSWELPVHTVSVSAFYMEQNLVTKAQWDVVYTWALTNGYSFDNAGSGKAFNHPVQSVSWYDCVKWCNARSEKEGLVPSYTVSGSVYRTGQNSPVCNMNASGYRLPTEAEWEKAARGGLSGKRFPWGDTITHSQANYFSSSSYSYDVSPTRGYNPTYGTGATPYTSPVGSFAANGYGLYDMAGNVLEWCWDWNGAYGSGAVSDPTGPASGSYRVYRGGRWYSNAYDCRVASRYNCDPTYSGNSVGFRCARSSVL
jgi:formylglycine-generating enzyme required for sulfatase activity